MGVKRCTTVAEMSATAIKEIKPAIKQINLLEFFLREFLLVCCLFVDIALCPW